MCFQKNCLFHNVSVGMKEFGSGRGLIVKVSAVASQNIFYYILSSLLLASESLYTLAKKEASRQF